MEDLTEAKQAAEAAKEEARLAALHRQETAEAAADAAEDERTEAQAAFAEINNG
jgi:hypothetical protein